MRLQWQTISVTDWQSTASMSWRSLKPTVLPPTFSGSRIHSAAYFASSQVSGSAVGPLQVDAEVQVAVIASPPSPGAFTPPLSSVGMSTARSGTY